MGVTQTLIEQSRMPSGMLGRTMLRIMNGAHRSLISWGLSQLKPCKYILDVSCGGGNAIFIMAKTDKFKHIYGIDLSEDAILLATKKNRKYIDNGLVTIKHASVSELPFEDDHFDAITTFQSHFHWPDVLVAMQEIHRVLKTGGQFVLVAEVYKIEYHMIEFNSAEKTKELFLLNNFKDVTLSTSQKSICICGYK